MKSAFLSPKGPWLLMLAALVFFVCIVAIEANAASWMSWTYAELELQALVVISFLLLLSHVVKVDVQIGDNPPNSPELHRQNLELQAMQHVVIAAVLNGNKQAGELARAAIDQLMGVGSLEYAKSKLDESIRTTGAIWPNLEAQQASTCTVNQACRNCPQQRFSSEQTPRAADTEAVIQSKGKTGQRVTPQDIEAAIAHEFYFSGDDGVKGAAGGVFGSYTRISADAIAPEQTMKLTTFCVLVLKNGFKVVGVSACADPSIYSAEEGYQWARKDAISKVWPLLGYDLRTKLASATA